MHFYEEQAVVQAELRVQILPLTVKLVTEGNFLFSVCAVMEMKQLVPAEILTALIKVRPPHFSSYIVGKSNS